MLVCKRWQKDLFCLQRPKTPPKVSKTINSLNRPFYCLQILLGKTVALTLHYLAALDALSRKLVLIALGAVDVVLLGDEGLST